MTAQRFALAILIAAALALSFTLEAMEPEPPQPIRAEMVSAN